MRVAVCWMVTGLVLLLGGGACGPPGAQTDPLDVARDAIYYGTRDPQIVSLTEGEKLAIGWLYQIPQSSEIFCSGTLIGPRVVITAKHCTQAGIPVNSIGFGVGTMPTSPTATFYAEETINHPTQDVAMLVLREDTTAEVGSLQPIPYNERPPQGLLNQQWDAAGYGMTQNGATGRFFAAVWLEQVLSNVLTVNGRGQQGICSGDSGGPLLGHGPVVLSTESGGEYTCVGIDEMVRLDVLKSWIDPVLERTRPEDPCDGITYQGQCFGDIVYWCEDREIQRLDCAENDAHCGWREEIDRNYCIPIDDPGSGGDVDRVGCGLVSGPAEPATALPGLMMAMLPLLRRRRRGVGGEF